SFADAGVAIVDGGIQNNFGPTPGLAGVGRPGQLHSSKRAHVRLAPAGIGDHQFAALAQRKSRPAVVVHGLLADGRDGIDTRAGCGPSRSYGNADLHQERASFCHVLSFFSVRVENRSNYESLYQISAYSSLAWTNRRNGLSRRNGLDAPAASL